MHTEKLCRACLSECDELTPLRAKLPGKNKTLEETINFVANVDFKLEDGLPDKICKSCETELNLADTFKQRLLKSESILSQQSRPQGTDEFVLPNFENNDQENSKIPSKDTSCLSANTSHASSTETSEKNIENKEKNYTTEHKIKIEIVEVNIEEGSTEENFYFEQNMETKPSPIKEDGYKETVMHSGDIKEYKCDECDKIFRMAHDIKVLKRLHWEELLYLCPDCYLRNAFGTSDAYTKKLEQSSDEEQEFSDSSTATTIKSELQPVIAHTDDSPYSCLKCKKKFPLKSLLVKHVSMHHTSDKPYSCNVCEMKYKHKHNYDNHIRTHTGEKQFSCNMCEKKFIRKNSLSNHIRTHSAGKTIPCPVCKEMSPMPTYNLHLKTHITGLKPYSCIICKKKYNFKNVLVEHIKTHTSKPNHPDHHSEQPNTCRLCGLKFRQKRYLNQHVKSYTCLKKPFTCKICKKKFKRNRCLKQHIKVQHNKQVEEKKDS